MKSLRVLESWLDEEFAIPATMKVVDADHWFREKGHTSETWPIVEPGNRPRLYFYANLIWIHLNPVCHESCTESCTVSEGMHNLGTDFAPQYGNWTVSKTSKTHCAKNGIGYDRIFFTHHTTAWGLCDACFDRYNTTCVRCNETIPDDELLLGCPWAGKPCSRILNKRSYSHAVTETTGKPQIAIRGDIRLVCAIFATRLECKHIGSAQEWTWFAWQDCHKKCTRPSTRKWQQFGNRQDQACFVCFFFNDCCHLTAPL